MTSEELAWQNTDVQDLWIFDKLILSKHLGYNCGPTGTSVPVPGHYIVRPCVNAFGLGLGASKQFIDKSTDHLPPGHFWCEWFDGDHVSIDYDYGVQRLAVQGFKDNDTFTQWDRWVKLSPPPKLSLPKFLQPLQKKYQYTNAEFIGDKLIEIHLRNNPDFPPGRTEYIPVWQGQHEIPPKGYEYIEDPDVHGRIGAWVR
mgnify:CR=1 FL=1